MDAIESSLLFDLVGFTCWEISFSIIGCFSLEGSFAIGFEIEVYYYSNHQHSDILISILHIVFHSSISVYQIHMNYTYKGTNHIEMYSEVKEVHKNLCYKILMTSKLILP